MPDRLVWEGWDAEIALVWTTCLAIGSGTPPPSSSLRQNVLPDSPKMRHLRLAALAPGDAPRVVCCAPEE
jgi:hypothetical protein